MQSELKDVMVEREERSYIWNELHVGTRMVALGC